MILRDRRGAILIITLWILTILVVFAIGLGYRVSLELKLSGYHLDRLKLLYLAKAAATRAIIELERDETPTWDALNESWSNGYNRETEEYIFKEVKLRDGKFTISYPYIKTETEKLKFYGLIDEERKINVNTAPREVLESLPDITKEIALSIIDWRDKDSEPEEGGAEDTYYHSLELPYNCKNGPFETIEELLLVKGITSEVLSKIKDMVTVYGSGKVNINTADEEVLLVLGHALLQKGIPEVGESEVYSLVEAIIRFRKGIDEEVGSEDDNVFTETSHIVEELEGVVGKLNTGERNLANNLKTLVTVNSSNFRINIVAMLNDGRTVETVTCVAEKETSKIKFWHEG